MCQENKLGHDVLLGHPASIFNSVNEFDVRRCTDLLLKRADIESIFAPINTHHLHPTYSKALVVGTSWYLFSNTVGEFLSRAAAAMNDNLKRFTLVQILWEELGEGQEQNIHADMFYKSVLAAGVSEEEIQRIKDQLLEELPLPSLKKSLADCRTDSEVLGLCAGVEAPAKENIEMVYSSLAHNSDSAAKLHEEPFFKLHRAIEEGHINLGTLNFLRFCTEPAKQEEFLRGFDAGVDFWRLFWHYVDDKLSSLAATPEI